MNSYDRDIYDGADELMSWIRHDFPYEIPSHYIPEEYVRIALRLVIVTGARLTVNYAHSTHNERGTSAANDLIT
jgi:hypothetical protein